MVIQRNFLPADIRFFVVDNSALVRRHLAGERLSPTNFISPGFRPHVEVLSPTGTSNILPSVKR